MVIASRVPRPYRHPAGGVLLELKAGAKPQPWATGLHALKLTSRECVGKVISPAPRPKIL